MTRGSDRGAMSLVAVALVVVAASFAIAVASAGVLGATASKAQGAADACALAAAHEARDLRALGMPTSRRACSLATTTAAEWGVEVVECSVDRRGRVTVATEATAFGLAVRREARAGSERAL